MTRRRQLRPPVALTAGILAVALLSGCGDDPGTPDGVPDSTAGGTVDQSPDPTTPDSTEPEDTSPEDTSSEDTSPGGTASPEDATRTLGPGEVLTPDDAGAVLRLAPGDEASLHLTPPWQDAVAEVADPAVVELVPVHHFADPGYAEYTLLAHAAGQTRLVVEGLEDRLELVVVVVIDDD